MRRQLVFSFLFVLIFFLTIVKIVKAPDSDSYTGCTSNADCGICGSGACQGYYKCVIPSERATGYCSTNCTTDGNSCTYTCPPDQCQGYKWCDYPGSVTGTCSSGECYGTCNCQSLTCDKNKCSAPCVPGETQTQSCSYCNGKYNCTGTQSRSCTSDCTWGSWSSCSASSCTCQVGYCGVTDASQCCPSGTYYKTNPWSNKWNCCSSSTDCVNYDGNCVSSGTWANGDNSGPIDYCSYGTWKSGACISTNNSSDCLPSIYTTYTSGCSYYERGCSPYVYYIVAIVECTSDSDCSGYDPTTNIKYVCECPNPDKCNRTGNSYTCKPKLACLSNSDCNSGWCCDRDPKIPSGCHGTGRCVDKGTLVCNNQYLCDPPEVFVSSSNENDNNQANKKLTLFDLLINPFSYLFIR